MVITDQPHLDGRIAVKQLMVRMKGLCWAMVGFAVISTLIGAQSEHGGNGSLYRFLQGSYNVIGKLPDSDQTYAGKVEFNILGDQLEVIRRIEGRTVKGIGRIETVTPDKIRVLVVRFGQDDRDYEATYLIDSDLDNYGRLTGYVYLADGSTKVPGLEALFIDHQALENLDGPP